MVAAHVEMVHRVPQGEGPVEEGLWVAPLRLVPQAEGPVEEDLWVMPLRLGSLVDLQEEDRVELDFRVVL